MLADAAFGRIGGEEFALLLPTGDEDTVLTVFNHVREAVEAIDTAPLGMSVPVTTSIGVTMTSAAGRAIDRLIAAADEPVYRAKDAGRNRVEIFRPEDRLTTIVEAARWRVSRATARAS